MKRLSGFSIIELLIIISMVTALVIVAAPSFYGIFKQQFLIYNSSQLIQNIRSLQSNAFIENNSYKIGFNSNENSYTIWKYNNASWQLEEDYTFDDSVTIDYGTLLSDSYHLVYSNNGQAYLCNNVQTPNECNTPLSTKASLTLKTSKKDIMIEFLPINGYVSSNIGVK